MAEWIKCSERMPDKNGMYIVAGRHRNRSVGNVVEAAYWYNGRFKLLVALVYDVHYWAPLPAHPEASNG